MQHYGGIDFCNAQKYTLVTCLNDKLSFQCNNQNCQLIGNSHFACGMPHTYTCTIQG